MEEVSEEARDEIARYEKEKGKRSDLDRFYSELGEHVMPEDSLVDQGYHDAGARKHRMENYDRLFDSTIARSNAILANGQFARVTPPNSAWFSFDPPFAFRDNERVVKWHSQLTEIARELLQKSRFYSQVYRLYLQRGGFGTGLLYASSTDSTPLYYRSHPVGSYVLQDNAEGVVDTVWREFSLGARQAAEFFGEENLSEEVRKQLSSTNPTDKDKETCYLHAVRPRPKSQRKKDGAGGLNMPIASIYYDKKAKKKVRESGHLNMPYMATRYHEMSQGPYGWGPGFLALPDARQLNFLEMNLDVLAERAATPSVIAPADLEGQIDLTAGGVTYTNPFAPSNNLPREWAQAGSYQHGEARAEHKRRAIEEAFHVRLFMLFNMMDDKTERTAREIQEKANERLTQFYPTFANLTTELLNPLLSQVFEVALATLGYDSVPGELLIEDSGRTYIPDPAISFSSSLGLAMKRVDNGSYIATTQILGPMIESKPELLDHFDWGRISRDVARNEGIPSAWLLDIEKVAEMQQARQQAAEEERAMLAAATASDAVSKTKGMPTDEIAEKIGLVA